MLRMIWITIYSWILNPFRKPKQPSEFATPTSVLLQRQDKGQPLAQARTGYSNGHANSIRQMPGDHLIEDCKRLLQQGGSHSGHDVIAFVIGSPMKLLTLFHDHILTHQPVTNSMALFMGASSTPGDIEALRAREMGHEPWERHEEGTGVGSVFVYHPNRHQIVTKVIGNMATTGGNGADQQKALLNLETDPQTAPDIRDFARIGVRSIMDYDPLGYGLLTIESGGGTQPLHQYGVELVKADLAINRHIRSILLPTRKEPLHVANLRGTVASILTAEPETQPSTLYCFKPQQKVGPHASDLAWVSGLITVSGASRDIDDGERDPITKFNLIEKVAGSFLLARPKVVEIPLKPLGRVNAHHGRLYDELFWVPVPDQLGGKRVSSILKGIHELVMEDASAPHFITVAYSLQPDEITYITEGVERFSMNEGGEVQLFFNPIKPIVSPFRNTAQCLLCDFRGGQGLRALLRDFLSEQRSTPTCTGVSWDEVRSLAAMVPQRGLTEKVEEQINRILKTDHF